MTMTSHILRYEDFRTHEQILMTNAIIPLPPANSVMIFKGEKYLVHHYEQEYKIGDILTVTTTVFITRIEFLKQGKENQHA